MDCTYRFKCVLYRYFTCVYFTSPQGGSTLILQVQPFVSSPFAELCIAALILDLIWMFGCSDVSKLHNTATQVEATRVGLGTRIREASNAHVLTRSVVNFDSTPIEENIHQI